MRKKGWANAAAVAMLVGLWVFPAMAGVQVNADWIVQNPQIFEVGSLVDLDVIQDPNADVDLSSIERVFQVDMIPVGTPPDRVYIEITLMFSGTELLFFKTTPFDFSDWDGPYTNQDLADLPFIHEDPTASRYADVNDFLGLIDGGNLVSGLYTIQMQVYNADTGALEGTYTSVTQAYNPPPPQLQEPADGDIVQGLPVFFSWTWNLPSSPNDMTLIVVEGEPGEDPQTVIQSRNPTNTRYEGPPQFPDYHTYTGASGTESALTPGLTYYWMVKGRARTEIPGRELEYASNIFSFTMASASEGGGGESGGGETGPGLDPVITMLSDILGSNAADMLATEFAGFQATSITIDGEAGQTRDQLNQHLNQPGLTVVSITVE